MRLRPPSQYNVASDFIQVYNEVSSKQAMSKADIGRLINLRCSQLPFCPTSLLLEYKLKGLVRGMDLFGTYYTTVGTAVHEVMQKFLALSGRFLADYVCHECGTVHHLTHQFECCGFPTHYHEVQIDFLGIQGHIDAIFKDSNGDYWILDFKTCSVAGAPKKKVSPGVGYIEQVESYAYLLYRQYGIKVKGAMLVFIPRDNPRTPVVWAASVSTHKFHEIHDRLKGYRKLHRRALAAQTKAEVWELTKHKCTNQWCRYCKLSDSALKMLLTRAFKTPHALPMGALQMPERPEASIVLYHNSPWHNKVQIKIKDIGALTQESVDRLGKKIHKELKKLRQLNDRNLKKGK